MANVRKIIPCTKCSSDFERVYNSQKYCEPCRAEIVKATKRDCERNRRRAAGAEGLGASRQCKLCDAPFCLQNGMQFYCDACSEQRKRETASERNKRYRLLNGERLREQERKWREDNYLVKKERQARYVKRCPDRNKARYKRYYSSKKNDPMFALNYRMRHGIWRSVKENKKGQPWEGFVKFTVDDLRTHLERQFLPGMGWHNMGQWHIDHVIPLALHKFDGPEDPDFRAAWSLPNLRPLWAEDNLKKNAKRLTLL